MTNLSTPYLNIANIDAIINHIFHPGLDRFDENVINQGKHDVLWRWYPCIFSGRLSTNAASIKTSAEPPGTSGYQSTLPAYQS